MSMDKADRARAIRHLTREQLVKAVEAIHDALYEVWEDRGPAGEGFAYSEGKQWTQDTLVEVADAINALPGLRPE